MFLFVCCQFDLVNIFTELLKHVQSSSLSFDTHRISIHHPNIDKQHTLHILLKQEYANNNMFKARIDSWTIDMSIYRLCNDCQVTV